MRRRALVVDDDEDMRLMVRIHLEHRGFGVTESGDPATALDALADEMPNLVVLDQVFPGSIATGVELALIIAARRPWTRVLLLTADPDVTEPIVGVDAVLNKGDLRLLGELADRLVPPDIADHS